MKTADLLREHQDVVLALCRRVLRHRQDAEDAAQEALLKIAREGPSIDDARRLRSWIHRVALNAALDLARRRRTRAGHEALQEPPAPAAEDPVAVHQAVADLPDVERDAVVEHFFHRRTLREIADQEGVTEQAVWKRVERAKQRLRGALALGAVAALPFLESPAAATTGKAGLIQVLLVGAPVALAAVAAAVHLARPAATPPPPPAPFVAQARPDAPPPAPTPPPAAAPAARPARPEVVRRPYPLALPPASWTKARAETFRRLRTQKVTLDLQDVSLREMLADIGRLSGETILLDDGIDVVLGYKVAQIPVEVALTLITKANDLAFDLQDDGTVRVARPDAIPADRLDELPRIQSALMRLAQAERRLARGWDGVDPRLDAERRAAETRVRMHRAVETPRERLDHLSRVLGCPVHDQGIDNPKLQAPRDLGAGEAAAAEHLDRLCAATGLGWYAPHDELLLLVPASQAAREREARAEQTALDRALASRLDAPLPEPRPTSVADLEGPASRALRAKAYFSEAAWAADLRWPPGARGTLREALDASGFRWALHQGDLFVTGQRR